MSDYFSIPTTILKIKDLSTNAKVIYTRIKAFEPEICRMIVADFIEELGISRGCVQTAIKELVRKQYVEELPYHGLKIIKEIETEAPAKEIKTKIKKTKEK
jgi:Mn-dependent DtxR family transcriptional regulator